MIQIPIYRKRHSPGRSEKFKWFSFLLIEKDILSVDKKTWNDSNSYL